MAEKWRNYFESENLSWWVGCGLTLLALLSQLVHHHLLLLCSHSSRDISLCFRFDFSLFWNILHFPSQPSIPPVAIQCHGSLDISIIFLFSFPLLMLSHPLTAMLVSGHCYFYCNKYVKRYPNTVTPLHVLQRFTDLKDMQTLDDLSLLLLAMKSLRCVKDGWMSFVVFLCLSILPCCCLNRWDTKRYVCWMSFVIVFCPKCVLCDCVSSEYPAMLWSQADATSPPTPPPTWSGTPVIRPWVQPVWGELEGKRVGESEGCWCWQLGGC